MRDDRIRIDPDFDAHPEGERDRRTAWLAATALVVAAGLLAWFMVVPFAHDGNDESVAVAAPAPSTAPTATTSPITEMAPRTPSTSRSSSLASLDAALSQAVPGFVDEIVLLATPPDSFKVVRWSPAEATTQVALALDRIAEYGCTPAGLDVSGEWFARIQCDGTLVVHPTTETREGTTRPEAIGLNAGSVAWHETEPGSIAWISCARLDVGPSTLYSLDVADPTAERIPLRTFEQDCRDDIRLEAWNDAGAFIESSTGTGTQQIVVQPGGAAVEASDEAIPGLGDDEPLQDAAWSPDRTLVAAVIDEHWDMEIPKLWVLDATTGERLAEMSDHGSDIVTMAWSTDSRFLVFEMWNFEAETGGLVVFDTSTNATTRIPLSEVVDQIRTATPD